MDDTQTITKWQDMAVVGRLTTKQLKTLKALLSCQTIKDVALQAGVGERTVYRWLKTQDFQQALHFAIRETTAETVRRLVAGKDKALDTLMKLLDADSESVQRNAAKDWLDFIYQHLELRDMDDRLSEIEKSLKP